MLALPRGIDRRVTVPHSLRMARHFHGAGVAVLIVLLSATAGPNRALAGNANSVDLHGYVLAQGSDTRESGDSSDSTDITGPSSETTDAPALAEQLLDRLAEAGSADEAKALETRVRQAWHRSGSDTIDLLTRRAGAAMKREDYTLALQYLDTIVGLRPDFAEAWNMRATVYYMLDEYDLSVADIEQVLSLQPRHFGALSGLGMIFRELDQPKQALEAFRRAVEINPYLESAEETMRKLELEVEGRAI